MLAVCQSFLGSSLHVRFVHPASASSSFQDPKCSLIDRHAAPSNENSEPVQDLLVSDAEALLACYAYLKRHMRLENSTWTQKERRQRMKVAAQPHFFWEEDLSKIAARVKQEMLGKFIEEEEDDDDDDDEHRETPLRPSRSSSTAEVWSGEFTSFPTEPSPTHARRSQSAKRTWTDPDFRERWYESRWGDKDQIEDPDTLEEKELENQVRALPSGFLGSPELSGMTEEEIQDAIKTYLTSTDKAIESRRKTLAGRKAMLRKQMEDLETGTSTVEQTKYQQSRDSLFTPDEATSKEAQRKRSERATKLYQKRLENIQTKEGVKISRPSPTKHSRYQANRATTQDAMIRIRSDLDSGTLPAAEDVKLIMRPGKLSKRRPMLRQILLECFNMRGKCVPMFSAGMPNDFEFVTKCAIDDLGALVINLIQTEERKDSSKS